MSIDLSGSRPKLSQTTDLDISIIAGEAYEVAPDRIRLPLLIQNLKPDSYPADNPVTVDYTQGSAVLTATSGDFNDNKPGDLLTTTPDFTNVGLSIVTVDSPTQVTVSEAITISPTGLAASIDTTAASPVVTDLGATFITSGVVVGDSFTSANFTGTATIISVDSETQLTVDINADNTAAAEAITIDFSGVRSSNIVLETTGFDAKITEFEFKIQLNSSTLRITTQVAAYNGINNQDADNDGVDDADYDTDPYKKINLPVQTYNIDEFKTNAGIARTNS